MADPSHIQPTPTAADHSKAQRAAAADGENAPAETVAESAASPREAPRDAGLAFLGLARQPGALGSLGRFEVLQVLGKGGFGIVLKAFDEKLQRHVAIKVMHPHVAQNETARKRFVREARAAAAVRDPHVVKVFEVEECPVPHLVMEYVEGQSLEVWLQTNGPPRADIIANIGAQIARGLAAAHRQGEVHRDIKPANILLAGPADAGPAEDGGLVAKITDFGLAKAMDDSSLTQSGIIAGTPMYMSPEQARGEPLDPRSDLFSLGGVLYFLCTGHTPFPPGKSMIVLRRVCDEEPRPIQEWNAAIPYWLANVVGKLLAKEPAQRYQTAAAVSAALQAGDSAPETVAFVAPRPAARRRRQLLAGGALALVVALAATAYLVTRDAEEPDAGRDPIRTGHNPAPLPALPLPEELAARPSAADALRRDDIPPNLLASAGKGDPRKAPPELVAVLGRNAFQHTQPFCLVAVSPKGNLVATAWAVFHDDGLKDYGKDVTLWDFATGARLASLAGHNAAIEMLRFSPDGNYLASASTDGTARIWDVGTKACRHTLTGHADPIHGLAFSPNGRRLATVSDKMVRLWDTDTGKPTLTFDKHTKPARHAAFTPDGKKVVSCGYDGTIRVWAADSGEELKVLRGMPNPNIYRLALNKDGSRVAAFSLQNPIAAVWNLASGEKELTLNTKSTWMRDLAWCPDDSWIAVSGSNGGQSSLPMPVRRFDPKTGAELTPLTGHSGAIFGISFSPNGKLLVGGGYDRRLHLWDVQTGKDTTPPFEGHIGPTNCVAFSPGEGDYLATGGEDGSICLWETATGKLRHTLAAQLDVRQVAFSPDGATLAAISRKGILSLWQVASGKLRLAIDAHSGDGHTLDFSPDGKLLATAGFDQNVKFWDPATGKLLRRLEVDRAIWRIKFSPDGSRFALADRLGRASLWDLATGTDLDSLNGRDVGDAGLLEIRDVAFHPQGQLLAVAREGPEGGPVILWDLQSLKEKQRYFGHKGTVLSCVWRADGELLVTAGYSDGTVGLWNPTASTKGKAIAIAPGLHGLALSPEGRYVATANLDGTVYILRLAKIRE